MTYGAETWTLKKMEDNALSVFERKVLRKIYRLCKDESTGEKKTVPLVTIAYRKLMKSSNRSFD